MHVLRLTEVEVRGPTVSTMVITSNPELGVISVRFILTLDLSDTWKEHLNF